MKLNSKIFLILIVFCLVIVISARLGIESTALASTEEIEVYKVGGKAPNSENHLICEKYQLTDINLKSDEVPVAEEVQEVVEETTVEEVVGEPAAAQPTPSEINFGAVDFVVPEPTPAPEPEPVIPEAASQETADLAALQSLGSSLSTETSNSTSGSGIVDTAMQYLGYSYVSGGSSPTTGFDCSGFTQFVYGEHGISIARVSGDQASNGTPVPKEQLKPGDLVLFSYYGSDSIGHSGIYIGDGNFIHAANSNRGVVIDTLLSGYYLDNYVTARRLQ